MSGAKAAPGWQIKASEIRREAQGVQWAGAPRVCCVQWEVCGRWRGGGRRSHPPPEPQLPQRCEQRRSQERQLCNPLLSKALPGLLSP